MRHLIILFAMTAMTGLAACEDGSYAPPPPPPPVVMADGAAQMAYESADSLVVTGSRLQRDMSGEAQPAAPMLAYAYSMGLQLPAAVLADTHARHAEACTNAGPAACQLIEANIADPGGDRPSAFLRLRAAPTWIAEFRVNIASEAEAEGGEVVSDTTQVEDLTARIVDSAARVAAQTTLRDRLQDLLATRDGDLADLLAVERELANVQADLDAQASVLAALRQRVATSTLTVSYQPTRGAVEPYQFDPIGDAIEDVGQMFAESVAAIIRFLASALPWLIVGGPVVWLVVWLFRRRRARKAPA